MPRQDVEDIEGKTPLVGPAPKPRRKLSKAELREQAAAAFLAWREGQTAKDKKLRSAGKKLAGVEQTFGTIVWDEAGVAPQPLTLNRPALNPDCSSGWGSSFSERAAARCPVSPRSPCRLLRPGRVARSLRQRRFRLPE